MKGKITIPYNTALSKNASHGYGRGRVYIEKATQAEMDAISFMIRPPFYGYTFTDAKVYVRIMVYRPDMKGDPINVQDSICDAIKTGIRRDDNVFAVSVDWELDKENPRIEIEVEQLEGEAKEETQPLLLI